MTHIASRSRFAGHAVVERRHTLASVSPLAFFGWSKDIALDRANSAAVLGLVVCLYLLVRVVRRIAARQFELERFNGARGHWWEFLLQDCKRYAKYRASVRSLAAVRTTLSAREDGLLAAAGMVTEQSRARFFLLREVLLGSALVVTVLSALRCSGACGLLLMAPVVVGAVWGPRLWVVCKRRAWRRALGLEQLLLIETVCAFSRCGRNPVEVLERYADLVGTGSGAALAYGLGRVRWCMVTGGTAASGLAAAARLPSYVGQLNQVERVAQALELDSAERQQQLLHAAREARATVLVGLQRRGASAVVSVIVFVAVATSVSVSVVLMGR